MRGALWLTMCAVALGCGCSKDADPASEAALVRPAEAPVAEPQTKPRLATEVVFETTDGEVRVGLEVVSTAARIQQGLMYRQHLAPDRGMLFVFATDRVRSFWMKNTLIPLDMLFVTHDMTVAGIERDTVPLSLDGRSIDIKTRYVIEVNGGWTAAHGVGTGTKLRFENMPEIGNPPL